MKKLALGLIVIGLASLWGCDSDKMDEITPSDQVNYRIKMRSTSSNFELGDDDQVEVFEYDSENRLSSISIFNNSEYSEYDKVYTIAYNQDQPVKVTCNYTQNTYRNWSCTIHWTENGFITEYNNYEDDQLIEYKLDNQHRIIEVNTEDKSVVYSYESNGLVSVTTNYNYGGEASQYITQVSTELGNAINPFKDFNIALIEVLYLSVDEDIDVGDKNTYAITKYQVSSTSGTQDYKIVINYTNNDGDYPIRSEHYFNDDPSPEYFYYQYEEVEN